MSKEHSLWGGRFSGKVDPLMESFNASIKFDSRLWKEDIDGSIAYANALAKVNILTAEEQISIIEGLRLVKEEWQKNEFHLQPHDEDIHTANERRLKEHIGAAGGKLHTGRSRNDQVATDVRLWCRDWVRRFQEALRLCVKVIVSRAKDEVHVLMPGYTHMQRAQPIRWSHLLLSYAATLRRDHARFSDLLKRINVCPLGSGALAGNPFAVDRQTIARELGFDLVTGNSMDGVGARDYILELQSCATLCSVNLSRMAEDLIIYSSKEFSFVTLADAYSTGSSLMPQKKNADSLELIRGKCGRIAGQFFGFTMTMKGTPSTYNKDFQEDKESLFDTCDSVMAVLQIATGVIATLEINEEKCLKALNPEMLSTDIAYYLVRKGVPFREAHGLAGRCVAMAERETVSIFELTIKQLKSVSDLFEDDVVNLWNYENSVEQYSVIGGTSLKSVSEQICDFEDWLQ